MDAHGAVAHDFTMGTLGKNCPACGGAMRPAPVLARDRRCGLRCPACETRDPLKSEQVAGWLNGELGRSETRPSFEPD
jgi:hypothetical protein